MELWSVLSQKKVKRQRLGRSASIATQQALSEQEKAPFKAQASADKQRHQQESACQAYRTVCTGFFCLVATRAEDQCGCAVATYKAG